MESLLSLGLLELVWVGSTHHLLLIGHHSLRSTVHLLAASCSHLSEWLLSRERLALSELRLSSSQELLCLHHLWCISSLIKLLLDWWRRPQLADTNWWSNVTHTHRSCLSLHVTTHVL